MSRTKAMKRMNELDKQGWRKLAKKALMKARNPTKYKVEGKGWRTKYFKYLASAAKYYHKLKKYSARPRITSLLFNCSVWTSLQVLDTRALKMRTKPRKLMAPRDRVPTSLIRKKIVEPIYTDEQWNTTLLGVRTG